MKFSVTALFAAFLIVSGAHTAFAATVTSTATGGAWNVGSTWIGNTAPANGDMAVIATTGGNSVTITANATIASFTVNAGSILAFSGSQTLTLGTANGVATVNGTVNGASGTIVMNKNPIVLAGTGTINSLITAAQPTSVSAGSNLTVTGIITIGNTFTIDSGATLNASTINSSGKTVANNGTVNLSGNYARTGGTAVWTQGTNSVLNISGGFTGAVTLNATASGNTINYNGSSQAIKPASYVNLTLSGSGAASMVTGTSVSGTMSVAPTGSATVSIGAGLTLTVANLTLSGLGRINGTWGSTSSTATYQNNTYFAATTGKLSVTNDTRATPTVSVTNSPVVYTGSGQAAAVSGSVSGTASNILTGGAATQTNVGTYAVTANFAPTDGTSYKSLTGASAGNFIINQASQTITFNALSDKTYGAADFPVSATASSGLTVSFASMTTGVCTVSIATVHILTTGTCTIRASQAGNTNYTAAPNVDRSFTINPLAVVLTGTRAYDGTATAAFSILSVSNKVGSDDVTVASGSGTLASANAGSQSISSFGTLALGGTKASNYTLTGATGSVTITQASQTITFNALSDKTLGDPDFDVSATASSGLTVSFSSLTTGVCTVSTATVHLVAVGTCTIRASQSGNGNYSAATPVDRSFTVNAGMLDHFAFAVIGTQTAGTPFSITITAQDAGNNTLFGYSGTVDLTTNAGTIVPTQSSAFSSGVRTESVTVSQAGTLKTITATDHGGTKTGTSNTFTVNPGALDHFSFGAISTQVASTPFDITMTAQDANNNTVTGYAGTVDLTTNAGIIAPTQSSAFSSGMRTESVTVTQAGTNKTITATDHGGTKTGTSNTFTVIGGAVAYFSLNDPGNMYAKTRLGYTVSRFDAGGNAVGTGTTTVYLYSSSTSSTKKFYDDSLAGSVVTSVDIGPGRSTANIWYYDEEPGTYTITASDNASAPDGAAGLADATDSVTVIPVATKFVILPPSNGTVDAPITVTVQAQKPDGSVDTNYQNNVTLHTSGSATGGGLVDIVNGVGTLNISDTHAETVTLSLADSETTGLNVSSTQSVVFAGGVIAQFTLTHPTTMAAGTRAAYTITREDQYGNTSSLATSTVYLYSSSTGANKKFYDAASGGSVITSVTIPDGQSTAQVWYYDETPGTWSITASDSTPTPNGNVGINDAVDTLQVTAGPVAAFTLNDPGDMTAGTRLGYTITRKDQFNNLVASGATTVYLQSNSTGTSTPVFYDAATDGNAVTSIAIGDGQSSVNVWYADPNPGTWTVTAYDNASGPDGATGVADATDTVTVSAAPIVATRFVISPPTNGTVDAPISVTVRAEDGSGDVDATYQSDVTLHTSGSATGGGVVDIVNGVGTLNIYDTHAETVNLSLTDSETTGLDVSSTQTATFAPGAVAQFSLDNPGDSAAGTRVGYTVVRKDQYGNTVTLGATTVYLYSSSTGANKKFYDAASGGSVITSIVIPDGQSSVGFWAYDEKAGSWFITVSDNATAPDSAGIVDASDALSVLPAAVQKFLLNDPGDMTAGTRLGYTVTREDQFSNLVTTGVTLAYMYSSSTGTTTAFYAAASGGAPTAFATINDGSSSGAIWYYDNTPGTWLVTASDNTTAPDSAGVQDAVDSVTVSAIPIVATRFVILPPAAVQVGSSATVTVEAQDASGNIDTTIQSGVTLAASGSATGAGLVTITNGVGTILLQDTVAETVTLSRFDTQSTGLDVSSTQSLTFSAVPVAPPTGGGGGGGAPPPSVVGVQLSGFAFPGAAVQILAVSPQGSTVQQQTKASASGRFSVLLKNVSLGIGSYGVIGVDALGRTTQTKVFNANYATNNSLLTLDTALSPTLGLVHPIVRQNDVVGFIGSAMPGYTVSALVDEAPVSQTATAAADGSYKILFPTGELSLGSHTVRVRQTSPGGRMSDYAPQKVFVVTTLLTPQTDFNQDGAINVQDWSIFLSRWSSTNPAVHMLDDLNGDGKVDVTDLSIFVRTLKK